MNVAVILIKPVHVRSFLRVEEVPLQYQSKVCKGEISGSHGGEY
jgi:hypothetical protein